MSVEIQETPSILPSDNPIVPPKNNDFMLFKEEIYNLIRDSETKLSSQINNQISKIDSEFSNFGSKINTVIENNKAMLLSIVTQKIKCEKISELEIFKHKVDDMLITHEIRINNSTDEIEKMKTKYDKILSDNLYVAGYVGQTCQFTTLSNYINYNINEVSKLRNEKDQMKRENKDLKNKVDNLLKSMVTLCDKSVIKCKEYTDCREMIYRNMLDNKLVEFNEKCLDIHCKFCQYEDHINVKIGEMTNEIKNLLNMRNEVNELINKKSNEFLEKNDSLNYKILLNIEDIERIRENMKTIDNYNKDLDVKIKELLIQMKSHYTTNNKIANAFQTIGVNVNNQLSIVNFLKKIKNIEKRENSNSIGPLVNLGSSSNNNLNVVKRNGNAPIVPAKKQSTINTTGMTINSDKIIERNSKTIQKKNNNDNIYITENKENPTENIINSKNSTKEVINTDSNNKNISIQISDDSSSSNSSKIVNKIDFTQNENNKLKINNKTISILEKNLDTNKINSNDFISAKTKIIREEIISRDNSNITSIDENKLNKQKNFHTTTSSRSILKNKILSNEKKINEDNDMCKLVKLNLDENFSTIDDDIFKSSMINKILKKDKTNFIVKNGKLELPAFSSSTEKIIKFKKNPQFHRNEIAGYGEVPKKTGQAFGRTIQTFYFDKYQCVNKNNMFSSK